MIYEGYENANGKKSILTVCYYPTCRIAYLTVAVYIYIFFRNLGYFGLGPVYWCFTSNQAWFGSETYGFNGHNLTML